MGNWSDRNKFT